MERAEDWLHAFYCMYIINKANNYWYFLGSRKIRTINSFIMEKNKNEELQSRRDFFKKAAKGVLPILGMVVVGPSFMSCSKDDDDDDNKKNEKPGCNGCSGSCSSSCSGSCDESCSARCAFNCGSSQYYG